MNYVSIYAKLAVVEIQKLASTKVIFTNQIYWSITERSPCAISTRPAWVKKKRCKHHLRHQNESVMWKNKGDSRVQTQHLEEPTVAEL